MKKVHKALGTSLLAAAVLLVPQTSLAEGPKPASGETLSINGFIDYAEMNKTLTQIEKNSKGAIKIESAGKTNQGRDIFTARVGEGKKVLLVESEIHGNEKTGTVALLNLLQYLGSSQSNEAKKIREELTIVAIPMLNADGSELDRRANDMDWSEAVADFPQLASAKPSWNYYTKTLQGDDYASNPGFDVNRDFNPDLNYVPQAKDFPGASNQPGWFITPESQTVRDVYKKLQNEFGRVDVFLDLHHQGFYKIEGTDEDVTMSISAQFVPDPRTAQGGKYAQFAENYRYDYSRQLNLALYNALQAKGSSVFSNISLYDQGLDLPGTALGSFALNGSGTVLFEVKGQTHSLGQKQKGMLVNTVETGIMGILNGVADGSVYNLNPGDYERIPNRVNP
ncbi:M14 family zinc carboxypeptidase [Fictibacillus terranigra]|uniref:M14 family zinc carboxypeptidase n=1 Tax=Fictibacillus terranigra TaxID=3058424 RepID=A0ABT8EDP1_9BACL|nr:M14 family zinc carboxypeptidase [Fictibacillus sp. CENA-BCM004]MDN4076034.1 M14 family zinc carboxypeptidase [Fictibacillus sp. CENA-BCM004]